MNDSPKQEQGRLRELVLLFLKLGFTAFGGPAAHIAMMEEEVVRRRQWLAREEFLDLLGATNLIPGPNSTEMAIHIGHRRAGWAGLCVAGICFIVPAMLIVLVCAWAYQKYGKLPSAEAILLGIKPVIISVVVQAIWGLGKSALKSVPLAILAVVVAGLNLAGAGEIMLLFVAGASFGTIKALAKRRNDIQAVGEPFSMTILFAAAAGVPGAGGAAVSFGLWPMFLFFLKIGSVLYGSGYVLLSFLQSGLVERYGWITEQQLLDAVAVGQFTPGPVFTTATFIGYLMGGTPAALAATVGIFLPAFVFVAISGPLIPRIRKSPTAGAVLDGVNAASLALMGVVALHLARSAVTDWFSLVLLVVSAILLVRFKVNSAWLILGGATAGWLRVGL